MTEFRVGKENLSIAKGLARRYQQRLWELADTPGVTPESPEYMDAQKRLTTLGTALDAYNKESRQTDENGKLTAQPDTWIAPKVDAPPKPAATGAPDDHNYFFEPSVGEVQNFIRNDPRTARGLPGVDLEALNGIAEPEVREDVLDPTSGAHQGYNVRPAVTWLDKLSKEDPTYGAVADYLWQQRMEQAKRRGEGVKRYRDIHFKPGQRVDYLAGGLEYNIDRRLAPFALGVADSFSAGQATNALDAAHDLYDYTSSRTPEHTTDFQQDVADPMTGRPVGQNTVTPGQGDPDAIPSGQSIIARSPGLHLAGNFAGYAMPGNPANAAQEMLYGGVAKQLGRVLPEMAARPVASAVAGAAVNAGESAINDFGYALNQGADPTQAAGYVGEGMPLNIGIGAAAGGAFDLAGQGMSAARQGLRGRPEYRDIQNLRAGGGDTSVLGGVTAPDEVHRYMLEAQEGRKMPDGSIEPPLGSAAALASDEVVPHIQQSMRNQEIDAAQGIKGENEAYFNHPAYRDIRHGAQPIVDEILSMADQGATVGPVTGAPGHIDPTKLRRVTDELKIMAEPRFMSPEQAQQYADANGYRVIDAQKANALWGRAEPPPAGTVAVIVPLELNASKLTQFEERIDRQFKEGADKSGYNDPIYTRINQAAKQVRDKFPYFEDEAGNLVAPPAAEGEFVDTPSSRGPETPPTESDPGPSLPPGGNGPSGGTPPALPEGRPETPGGEPPFTMRSVAPEEATPLSLLSGNKLAMEAPRDGNTEPLTHGAAPSLATAIRSSTSQNGLAGVADVVKAMGGDVQAAHRAILDAYERGAIELRPEGGLNRLTPEERKLVIPGPHGTELSSIRVLDEGALGGTDESLPAPSPKEWTEATGEAGQWFDDIVAPGSPARNQEAKRLGDLTAQQGAMEEAQAQIRDIEDRFGNLSPEDREKSILGIISAKLGREVTKEELVKAGLMIGGAATLATSDDNDEAGAAAIGASVLIPGRRGQALEHGYPPSQRTGRNLVMDLRSLGHGTEAFNQLKSDLAFMGTVPHINEGTLSDIRAQVRTYDLSENEEQVVGDILDRFERNANVRIAPRRSPDDVSYRDMQRATEEAATRLDHGEMRSARDSANEALLDDIGTYVGRDDNGLPVVDRPGQNVTTPERQALEAAGHKTIRGTDVSLRNVLGQDGNIEHLKEAWDLDALKKLGDKDVGSAISPYGRNGVVLRATGSDAKGKAWQIERVIRREGGQLIAEHQYFKLRDDLQAGGEGAKVVKQQMEAYRKMGVSQVVIDHAAWVGRYYWPSLGFDNPDAVPAARKAYREYLINKHGFSESDANKAATTIKSLPTLANAEFGKDFLLDKDSSGEWNHNLRMSLKDSNPRFQLMRKRLDFMIGAGVALYGEMNDDESDDEGTAAAGVFIGGMGGGGEGPKGPRQPRATLENGQEVKGFSAVRHRQSEKLSAIEKNRDLTSANHERTLRKKVINFNQSDDIDTDRALEAEAKKAGKVKELRTTVATRVYPELRRRAMPGSGRGFINNAVDMGAFRADKILEVLGGEPRNPFARDPNGITADAARRFFNLRGGRPSLYANDLTKIYNELYGEQYQEDK